MSDNLPSPPHPELLRLLRSRDPHHPHDSGFWKRLAVEVGDTFRPDVASPLYHDLIDAKLRYVLEGVSEELYDSLRQIRAAVHRELAIRLLRSNSPASDDAEETELQTWLRQEVADFERHVMSQAEVGNLEELVLQGLSRETGKNLSATDIGTRSREFLRFLQTTGEAWEGLPNSLMQHILRSFPRQQRDPGFWERIQRHVGPHYAESGIEHPPYVELLNLQIRTYGFREQAVSLQSAVRALRDRLKDSTQIPEVWKSAWSCHLDDLETDLRQQRYQRDRDDAPNATR